MKVKHSVLVISYNQEELIRECLDSIIGQSSAPYEIIIADDCSKDNTFGVLLEYAAKYPDLVKPYQNETNLGIFGNINALYKKPSGDMIHLVAGDDMIHVDMLAKQTEFILANDLNCADKFMIITNVLKLKGSILTEHDNYKYRDQKFIKSDIRTQIHFWDNGYSKGLLNAMPEFRSDLGNHADTLQHVGRNSVCDQVFFINEPGYIYRENTGVTVKSDMAKQAASYKKILEIVLEDYGSFYDNEDLSYIRMLIEFQEYFLNPSIYNYFKFIRSRFKVSHLPHHSPYRGIKILVPISIKRNIKRLFKA